MDVYKEIQLQIKKTPTEGGQVINRLPHLYLDVLSVA